MSNLETKTIENGDLVIYLDLDDFDLSIGVGRVVESPVDFDRYQNPDLVEIRTMEDSPLFLLYDINDIIPLKCLGKLEHERLL